MSRLKPRPTNRSESSAPAELRGGIK